MGDKPEHHCSTGHHYQGKPLDGSERDLIHADLGQLLELLGLGDYARPESSHEVFQQCIAAVARLQDQNRMRGKVIETARRHLSAAP